MFLFDNLIIVALIVDMVINIVGGICLVIIVSIVGIVVIIVSIIVVIVLYSSISFGWSAFLSMVLD